VSVPAGTRAQDTNVRGGAGSALTPWERVLVDAIAECVSHLLRSEPPHRRLVDAATLAGALGMDRSYVYVHAEELGAVRLGGGSKPRLRFDLETASKAMARYAGNHSQGSNATSGPGRSPNAGASP
jgi:hypothetical protein